jgi:hypothetical protein
MVPFYGLGNCKVKERKGSKVIDIFWQSGHLIYDLYCPASKSVIFE